MIMGMDRRRSVVDAWGGGGGGSGSSSGLSSDESTAFAVDYDEDGNNPVFRSHRLPFSSAENEGSRKRNRSGAEIPEPTRLQRLPSFRNIEDYNRITKRMI